MIVTKLHEFNGHVDCIYTAAINYPLQQLYTAGGDGIVAAWDCNSGGDGAMQVRVKGSLYSMCLHREKLLLGSSTGNLFIIDLDSKAEERNIEAHSQGIFDIVYDEQKNHIYTCGFDGVLNVWDADFNLLQRVKLSDKSLRNICILPEGIAVACSDFYIYILNRDTFIVEERLKHHINSVFALAYNPLSKELLSGGRDCYLKVWDTGKWELKHEYVGATLHINHICFDPGFSYYSVSSMDKAIKIFDAITHEPVKFITKEKNQGHTSSVNKTLWLNQNTLISISDDKKAMSWEIK
jgi:WD40 repeat protein